MHVTGSDGRGFEEPIDVGVMAENPGLHSRPAVDAMLLAKVRMGGVRIAVVFGRERLESTLAVAFHVYLPATRHRRSPEPAVEFQSRSRGTLLGCPSHPDQV